MLVGRHIVKFFWELLTAVLPQFNSHSGFAKSGSFEHFKTLSRINSWYPASAVCGLVALEVSN